MTSRYRFVLVLIVITLVVSIAAHTKAQGTDLVASLERVTGKVEIKRAGTSNYIAIAIESLVGVGDSIRTDSAGQARITFFANGTDTVVQPASEFRIDEFSGSENQYQLSVTVLVGQTTQRIAKLLDSNSTYTINSTGLELAVRGTSFAVRVEQSGRSSTVVQTGAVKTKSKITDGKPDSPTEVEVSAGNGIRAETGKGLSDVVPAKSFDELDAAIDGCKTTLQARDDVQFNLRTGPNRSFPLLGTLATDKVVVVGTTETSKWYRISYKNGYAWFNSSEIKIDGACKMLRKFSDKQGAEDVTRYKGLDATLPSAPADQATAAPTATK